MSDDILDILFVGDIVGKPGRDALAKNLEKLHNEGFPDLVIVNGENAAGGYGLTEDLYREMLGMGVGVVTLGNHSWDKQEIFSFISEADRLIRPINYPEGTPGRGWTIVEVGEHSVAVVNVMGRAFMNPLDCPFRGVDKAIDQIAGDTRVIIVDVHAEATAEKRGLAWHLDGRVSAVLGTHTHVQTADEHVMPGGTAFLTDVGMTGPFHSVIGMKKESAIRKMMTALPGRLEVADGPGQFNAARLRVEAVSGRALSIERLNYR